MKKISYLLLIILVSLFIPNVNAKEEVSIESINLVDKSELTTELSSPTKSGLKIGFDLSFSNVGNYAKYEVVVNNDSNKEYEINDETSFSSSNYIEYKYEFKEKTNRVKANSKVTLYITVTYKNAVPNDKLVNGKYIENNEMAISLSNEDNPKTFSSILYLLLFIALVLVFTFFINSKNLKNISIIVIALLLVPVTIFALEKLRIGVTTKITIEEKYKVSYNIEYLVKEEEKDSLSLVSGYKTKIVECKDFVKYNVAGKKYDSCEIEIYSYFSPGRRVQMVDVPYKSINVDNSCDEDLGTGIITCPDDSVISVDDFKTFKYEKDGNANDKEIMNFDDIEVDSWDELSGYIILGKPNSFTMPEHDVKFSHIDK